MLRTPSSKLWLLVHVGFPLLPFVLETFLPVLITASLSLDTFSTSTLAMSVALLALFVSQSLINSNIPLRTGDREDALRLRAGYFLLLAGVLFVLFGVFVTVRVMPSCVGVTAAVVQRVFVTLLAVHTIDMAHKAQNEFKLKVAI